MSSKYAPPYPSNWFRRMDETSDALFYVEPRLVVHVDDRAIATITKFLGERLPKDGVILDLMSSWRSHLPRGFPKRSLVGLGMNKVELDENPQLDERVVHDLNVNPKLPLASDRFDAAVVTVSIQYMTRPIEVFREVNRVLKDGAPFYVIYSNRMFPTKAVAIWHWLDDEEHGDLIKAYFEHSGGWDAPEVIDATPAPKFMGDPVYVVTARKRARRD